MSECGGCGDLNNPGVVYCSGCGRKLVLFTPPRPKAKKPKAEPFERPRHRPVSWRAVAAQRKPRKPVREPRYLEQLLRDYWEGR